MIFFCQKFFSGISIITVAHWSPFVKKFPLTVSTNFMHVTMEACRQEHGNGSIGALAHIAMEAGEWEKFLDSVNHVFAGRKNQWEQLLLLTIFGR